MILKMMLIVVGIFLLILDLFMYARQKLTDGIGLGWAIVSAIFLVSGIAVSTDAATYLWNGAKSVALFAFAVFVVIILFLFKISMAVSVVVVKNQELAMQVSLLNQENEKTKDVQYELSLYVLMGQGELVKKLPKEVLLKNKSYQPLSVLQKEGRHFMYRTILKTMFVRGTVFCLLPYLLSSLADMLKRRKVLPDKLLWRVLSDGGERFAEEYDLAVAYLEGGSAYYVADHVCAKKKAAFIHIDYTKAGYTRKLDRDCYLKYDAIFPIGEDVKQQFLKVYPECAGRTKVFHNIIDTEKIKTKASLPGGFSDDFDGIRLLTVGRLTEQKSYPTAIRAMKKIKEKHKNVRWYVLGEGPERKRLEHLIDSLGLQEDFILSGSVENPYPYYKSADIYVHATGFEGKSIAIQEAQTLGLPIIASESNREQIEDGVDGILCRLEPEAVSEAVCRMMEDEKLRNRYREASLKKNVVYEKDMELLTGLLFR